MCLRITLLGVDEAWKQYRVSNEKYWCVISDQIPVSFIGVKLYCETTWVSRTVCTPRFPA